LNSLGQTDFALPLTAVARTCWAAVAWISQLTLTHKFTRTETNGIQLPRQSINLLLIIGFGCLLAGFSLLAFSAHTSAYFPIDLALTRAIQGLHSAWFGVLMRGVAEPGYPPQTYVWTALMLVVLFASGLRWEAAAEAFATVGIGVVGLIAKVLVNRPRPSPDLINVLNPALDGGKYSFPAGHVQVYVAVLGFLIFLAVVLPHRYAWMRVVEIIGFGTLIALIGLSRIYVGEHWPSDVLGAYMLGSLWLGVTIVLYLWGKPRLAKRGVLKKHARAR
jgi:membrane-associated phospholipid phosphatase